MVKPMCYNKSMTIYINHNSPQKYLDLTIKLVQGGIAGQNTATMAAEWIIDNRVVSWKGYHFVHLD